MEWVVNTNAARSRSSAGSPSSAARTAVICGRTKPGWLK
jgi:hypothetical protein